MNIVTITIFILLILFTGLIFLMKKIAKKNNIDKELIKKDTLYKKEDINKEITNINNNPIFTVNLLNYKNTNTNIYKSNINDKVNFKKSEDKRVKVYNDSKLIGAIAIKDYKEFPLIATHPQYFEGTITALPQFNNSLKKVTINVQVKKEKSIDVYKLNNQYLHKLIKLNSLFEIGQIVETSYGPSTIIEIHDIYLIVDIPSLGKREIYDITNINI